VLRHPEHRARASGEAHCTRRAVEPSPGGARAVRSSKRGITLAIPAEPARHARLFAYGERIGARAPDGPAGSGPPTPGKKTCRSALVELIFEGLVREADGEEER
jgi:hypothetical protein